MRSDSAWRVVLVALGLCACGGSSDLRSADAAQGQPSSDGSVSAGRDGSTHPANGDAAPAQDGSTSQSDAGGRLDELGMAPTDLPNAIEVGVKNACPFPIWIHAEGKQGVLMPDDSKLSSGDVKWYSAPTQWEAARITAFGDGPRQGELEKVEATLVADGDAAILNYNVTYVDWLGLPVSVLGIGTGDGCQRASCDVAQSQVLSGCPDGLLEGMRCVSPRSYCLNPAHDSEPACHVLDDEIARCASTKSGCEGASGASTAEAFACSGFFASSPKWCAALNRGTLDDPDSTDLSIYYKNEPYNDYAKWVHGICPGIYAFAYDDYPSGAQESGFHACGGGRELHVTFCPRG